MRLFCFGACRIIYMKVEDNKFDALFKCPFGGIGIRMLGSCLASVDFIYEEIADEYCLSVEAGHVSKEIQTYFTNPHQPFSINLAISGTSFQTKVWQQLQLIPAGQTKTYGEIANELGSSARAVGNACRNNPVPLVIPCHRVVAKNGLGGFSGATSGSKVNVKQWLLSIEAQS